MKQKLLSAKYNEDKENENIIENLIINENIIERKELLQIMKKLPARKTYR